MVREGLGTSLYNLDSQKEFQQNLFPNAPSRPSPLHFIQPAYETLFFIPVTCLSYPKAYILWTLVNVSILALLSFLFLNHFRGLQAHFRLVSILCFFLFILPDFDCGIARTRLNLVVPLRDLSIYQPKGKSRL